MDYRGNGGRMRIEYKGGTMRNCLPMNCQSLEHHGNFRAIWRIRMYSETPEIP